MLEKQLHSKLTLASVEIERKCVESNDTDSLHLAYMICSLWSGPMCSCLTRLHIFKTLKANMGFAAFGKVLLKQESEEVPCACKPSQTGNFLLT